MTQLTFKCFLERVKDEYPIEKISVNHFKWLEKANNYYRNNPQSIQTNKCPGIIGLLQTGWIQRAYQDITITTNGDGTSFEWRTPYNQKKGKFGVPLDDYVSSHSYDQLEKFRSSGDHCLNTVIKIQSPWHVSVPKNYYLLSTAVPYNDDNSFSAATGLLKGDQYLNIQLFWHKLKGTHTIKAGTPLCYYLLIERKKMNYKTKLIKNIKEIHKEEMHV